MKNCFVFSHSSSFPFCGSRFSSMVLLGALALLLPGGFFNPRPTLAQTAREIMQRVNDRDDGDNQQSDLTMVLIDRRGKERTRSIRSFRKDFGKDTRQLLFFLAPADMKNTGFLTYDYAAAGKDDDQWLFLPALRKTKRISSGDKSGSFMGSDFNYSDMTRADLDKFAHKIIKEEEVAGEKTWRIEVLPRSPATAEETGYDRSVVWVRQDIFMTIRAVQEVRGSQRKKFLQITKTKQVNGIWVAAELQMTTRDGKRTLHATILRFDKIAFNQPLGDELFTIRRLEKGL